MGQKSAVPTLEIRCRTRHLEMRFFRLVPVPRESLRMTISLCCEFLIHALGTVEPVLRDVFAHGLRHQVAPCSRTAGSGVNLRSNF